MSQTIICSEVTSSTPDPMAWTRQVHVIHNAATAAQRHVLSMIGGQNWEPTSGGFYGHQRIVLLVPWKVRDQVTINGEPLHSRSTPRAMCDNSGRPIIASMESWRCLAVMGYVGMVISRRTREHNKWTHYAVLPNSKQGMAIQCVSDQVAELIKTSCVAKWRQGR